MFTFIGLEDEGRRIKTALPFTSLGLQKACMGSTGPSYGMWQGSRLGTVCEDDAPFLTSSIGFDMVRIRLATFHRCSYKAHGVEADERWWVPRDAPERVAH